MKAQLSAINPPQAFVCAHVHVCLCVCACVRARSVFPSGALVPDDSPPGAEGRPLVDALLLAALVFVYPEKGVGERRTELG